MSKDCGCEQGNRNGKKKAIMGLYANIHAKRKRGGKMKKKGAKGGAPTAANFKRAKKTAKKKYGVNLQLIKQVITQNLDCVKKNF